MLFPESTPKKKRRHNKENEPPAAGSPQASPGGRNAVGNDDGFTNQSMSIIPSSLSLAATAMTTLAARSAARASARKAQEKEDSVENPRPSTSKAAAALDSPPRDPFAPEAMGSKHGKGTKGLKGRAKVRIPGVSDGFPCVIASFFSQARALEAASRAPPNKKAKKQQEKQQEQDKVRKNRGKTINSVHYLLFQDKEADDNVVPEELPNSDDDFAEVF